MCRQNKIDKNPFLKTLDLHEKRVLVTVEFEQVVVQLGDDPLGISPVEVADGRSGHVVLAFNCTSQS